MKNKFILLLMSGVLLGTYLNAQSLTPVVIASSGGYFSSAAGSLSATVGEMTMVKTFTSAGNILTQGFQQPFVLNSSINELEQALGDITVYPNPSNGKFNISVNSTGKGIAGINVYDLLGQLTVSKEMPVCRGENNANIDIRNSSTGIYLLQYLYTGDNGKKELKIVKIKLIN